jgi:hypothetical protein
LISKTFGIIIALIFLVLSFNPIVIGYIEVGSNSPPDKPIISGRKNGTSGNEYRYNYVSTDPDGDSISYFIDWGDGSDSFWSLYIPSGIGLSSLHTWDNMGIYIIRVKAKDHLGAESEWATLKVTMPTIKANTNDKKLDSHVVFISGKSNSFHGSGIWFHIGPIWWIRGTFGFDFKPNIRMIVDGELDIIKNPVKITLTDFRGFAPGIRLLIKIMLPGAKIRLFGVCNEINIE